LSRERRGDRIRYDFSNFDRWVEIFRNKGGFTFIEGSWVLGREHDSYTGQLVVPVFLLENGKVTTANQFGLDLQGGSWLQKSRKVPAVSVI
jgi:hypothetical protein